MSHPFEQLRPEYEKLLATVMLRSPAVLASEASRRIAAIDRYLEATDTTTVPPALIMAIHVRESSGSFNANLCNGDPLTRPTTHVPAGRPTLDLSKYPVTWAFAARDAISYDRLDVVSSPWSLAYACWKAEAYNGFGPRAHGIHSGYLWAGSNHYARGKYVADGVWNPDFEDKQLGAIPLMLAIAGARPDLKFGPDEQWNGAGALGPVIVKPPPIEVGGSAVTVKLVQTSLNVLHVPLAPLVVDGSFGRLTRAAVLAFETTRKIEPADGLLDPVTIDRIVKEAANRPAVS